MFVHKTFSSGWVAEWPPYGKELPTRLAVCSHCILSIVILVISRCGFEGGGWFLIAPVPVFIAYLLLLLGFWIWKCKVPDIYWG